MISTKISGAIVLSLLAGGPLAAQETDPDEHPVPWTDPLGELVLDYVRSNSETRPILPNGAFRQVAPDAMVNPLLQDRGGREYIEGDNLAIETTHSAGIGSIAAVHLHNRFQLTRDTNGDWESAASFREFYATVLLGNLRVTGGRSHLFLGQGARAGIMLSHNARALDHVRFENDEPFRLPWILGALGRHSVLVFGGDLGPNQNFAHAAIFGFRWSWMPIETVQLSATFSAQMGGEGSGGFDLGDVVTNTLPLSHILFNRQADVGNKIGGFDFRVAIPSLSADIYGEAVFDDIRAWSNFREAFTEASGYLLGASFDTGFLQRPGSIHLEAHRIFPILYFHTRHVTGWAMDGFLLGDNLGPDAIGLQGWWEQPLSETSHLSVSLAYEIRRNDIYDGSINITKINDRPDERRIRATAALRQDRFRSGPLAVEFEFGVEQVRNFLFATGDSRLNYMSRVAFVFRPQVR